MNTAKKIVTLCLINFVFIISLILASSVLSANKAQTGNLSNTNPELFVVDNSPAVAVTVTTVNTMPANTAPTSTGVAPANTSPTNVAPTKVFTAATATPKPQPTKDPRCIVLISGVKYDVTSFRNSHSGGDIFTCGTDMTNVFFGEHNQRTLILMERYKI